MENEKKDCFAYPNGENTECYCLKECYCKKEKCGFYKPKTEITISEIERAVRTYATTGIKQ